MGGLVIVVLVQAAETGYGAFKAVERGASLPLTDLRPKRDFSEGPAAPLEQHKCSKDERLDPAGCLLDPDKGQTGSQPPQWLLFHWIAASKPNATMTPTLAWGLSRVHLLYSDEGTSRCCEQSDNDLTCGSFVVFGSQS